MPGMSLRTRAAAAWRVLGPGFVTGSSDDDPSGIQTYSQTGAQFGYAQLWLAVWTYPFMAAIQEICGRIGMVTGRGLGAVLRDNYPRSVLHVAVLLLLIANTVNVGADLGAMAATGQLLVHVPFLGWLAVIVAISLALQIFVPYPAYARFLKYACLSLLAYVVAAFVVHHPWWPTVAVGTILLTSNGRATMRSTSWRCSEPRSRLTVSSGRPTRRPRRISPVAG